ncbi:hypothetical protein LPJ66_002762 [Kickxella alabastrina]|uniref:Uncharacterized protein n=1 Tax=Kickxella alabastrina TaxID=61397 RepID=A0ACC1IPK8_9FUNG|nr:hypothetical protein LPJ66_002762 [Kickxella alabastrina]
MTSRLLAYHLHGARWIALGRRVSPVQFRRNASSSDKQSDPTIGASEQTAELKNDSEPSVVETSPVYSRDEIETADDYKTPRGNRTGARSDFIKEREPVVVHNLAYPIHNNKWYRIVPESVDYLPVGYSHINRVPKLGHGLERVLFSPGVHCLEDPHSGVYNFDPYIRNITQPAEFDYDKLTPYITSSKDETLMGYARQRRRQFVGSTSSMTHVLSHLYFAIAAGKKPDISSMSMAFADMPTGFTRGMRYPASIALRYHDGVYAIDADKSFDVGDSILSILGKSLEKLLTSTPKEFDMYKKMNSWKVKDIPEENYHYVEFDEFVLRSQLDCRDDRLPRKTFDLKTRGSLAVRMDLQNYEISKGYQIHAMKGRLQSFEREYYDMVRSAFLKYNFQTRIGNMDGIFVAYHNTARMFGFQYISRQEMDRVLFGNEATGNKAFKSVLILLGKLLRTVTDQFPKRDIRVTFDSASSGGNLDMWVEVINDEAEAVAMQQYQENGIIRAPKVQPKKASAAAEAGGDPFSTADPLSPNAANKDGQEDELAAELEDAEIDPVEFIYVNSEEPILKYTMQTFSTYNNQDTDGPVTVKNKDEHWYINWKLAKSHKSQDEVVARYRVLRHRQATYFERASPETPDEELSPMLKILRRISRKNLWRNELPVGKVVVNRSRIPNVQAVPKPLPAAGKIRRSEGGDSRKGSNGSKKTDKTPLADKFVDDNATPETEYDAHTDPENAANSKSPRLKSAKPKSKAKPKPKRKARKPKAHLSSTEKSQTDSGPSKKADSD